MEVKPKSGRPPVLSTRAKLVVTRKHLKQPGFGGLARAAKTLQLKGYTRTPVHVSTLSRMLKDPRLPFRPFRLDHKTSSAILLPDDKGISQANATMGQVRSRWFPP